MEEDDCPKIEAGYGLAAGGSAFSVGIEAAKKALSAIHAHAISALLIFASGKYNLEEVLKGIHSVSGDVPVFGTTTAGEICDGIHKETVVVVALASPYLKVSCGIGTDVSKDWQKALDAAVNSPNIRPFFQSDIQFRQEMTRMGKNVFVMIFSPGNTRKSNSKSFEILEALKMKSLGRFSIVGGSSADDWRLEKNHVLYGQQAYPDSLLLAVFETELQFGISLTHGFRSASLKTTVTSVEGHEVLTLDGVRAADMVSRLLGFSTKDLQGKHISLATGHTLGTSDPMGQYSINVASYFTHRGGLLLTQPVTAGTVLTLMEPNTESMVSAGTDALRKAIIRGGITDIAICLVNYCALRRRIMGEKSKEEISGMTKMLDGKPIVGFYSFGEQGVADDGVSRHNNSSVSCLVFGSQLSQTAHVAFRNSVLLNELNKEIEIRKRTEEALRRSREELELRVMERTSELIIALDRLRNLAVHLLSISEQERTKIARDIHDELGQALTAIKIDLSWFRDEYGDHKSILDKTHAILNVLDATIISVKHICTELRPWLLDDLGLFAAMQWQANEFEKRTGIECTVIEEPLDIELDKERNTVLYRIFQEALTNVLKHAKATKVTARLMQDDDHVMLEVMDNGEGITKEQLSKPQSFGLMGMIERVYPWGGKVEITGTEGGGTMVRIIMPMSP